jgi:hypothetical protein
MQRLGTPHFGKKSLRQPNSSDNLVKSSPPMCTQDHTILEMDSANKNQCNDYYTKRIDRAEHLLVKQPVASPKEIRIMLTSSIIDMNPLFITDL